MRSREMRDLIVIVIVIALFMWGVTFTTGHRVEDPPIAESASAEVKAPEPATDAGMRGQQAQGFVQCTKGQMASNGCNKSGGHHGGRIARAVDLATSLSDTYRHLASGQTESALETADGLTRQFANDPRVWVLRGRCNEAAGRHVQALDDVQTALRLDHRLPEAWELQVTVLNSLDRKAEAEESRQKLQQLKRR